MKAFQFKLERILAIRKHREREWEIRLAQATGECVQLRRDIESRVMHKAEALRRMGLEHLGAGEMLESHLYMARLDQEAERKSAELVVCERERERIQGHYLEASKDRKVLDKLREKRSGGYLKEQRTEEIKELDDINTGRAARRR
jgi:flagellar protein FliJ